MTKRQAALHQLVHSPNVHKSYRWARPKQKLETQSKLPLWMTRTQELGTVTSEGNHQLEAGTEVEREEPGLEAGSP